MGEGGNNIIAIGVGLGSHGVVVVVVVCGWEVSKGGGGPLTAASAPSFCRVPAGSREVEVETARRLRRRLRQCGKINADGQ